MEYTRQHQSAERAALRRWLRVRGFPAELGDEPSVTERLMKTVLAAGGDPQSLMREARGLLDAAKRIAQRQRNRS